MTFEGTYNNQSVNIITNKYGNLLTNNYATTYQEAVLTGNVYSVANQTGITTQAGLSATTPALTLYNPAGSGVNGVLLFAGCINTVAFAAASVIWVAVNSDTVAARTSGTLSTVVKNNFLGAATGNKVQALLAATLPATPVAVSTLGVGLTGAISTLPQLQTLGKLFDGSLIIGQGASVSLQTSTASGASGFFGEFVWFEVPA